MRFYFIVSSLILLLSLTACQTGDALSTAVPTVKQSQTQNLYTPNISAPVPTATPSSTLSPTLSSSVLASVTPIETPNSTLEPLALASSQYANQQPQDVALNDRVAKIGEIQSFDNQYINQPLAPVRPRTQKTYLINGLMSAIPFIGFGFRNLHKKMPEAQLYSYLSPVESVAVIMPKVMRDIQAAHAKDPNVSINLIGISLGADFVSIVAEKLHRKNIPVNYLGIVDGTSLRPVQSNVKKVDNLTCTYLDCVRGKVRLATGNTTTIFIKKKYKSSHIPLGNNNELHKRVIAQSRS